MPSDLFSDDLDYGQTIQIPRFGVGQKIFRRYTLQRILGRGGMGVVWLARDEQLESLVALKVLPESLTYDHAALDALKRETKLGLHLAHPNIVRIYDFQQDDDAVAISMEYVDGVNLSEMRISQPHQVFTPAGLWTYLEALCDALHYAHTREKIVHRDLKPRNLMLNSAGELKIADFGISRSISESMTMMTGMLGSAGSPPYISPQQWDGDRPTPLDDIYSVGATLYELLSSRPPLLGVVDWQQVHSKIPPPIWERRLDLGITDADPISPAWEETIAACLAKDPKDRPQTIRDLHKRLTSDQPIAAVAETDSAPPAILVPEAPHESDLLDDSFSAEATQQDIFDDTIVISRGPPDRKPDAPAPPAVEPDLTPPEPALSELPEEVLDQPAPQDFPENASEIPLPIPDAEPPATTPIADEHAPLEVGSTISIDDVALPSVEEVATHGEAVFPSTETEGPAPPAVEPNLPPPEPALSELQEEVLDQPAPAPQDFPEGASEIPLPIPDAEPPATTLADEPAPLEIGSTSSIDAVALPPVEKVATHGETVFPSTGTEIPAPPAVEPDLSPPEPALSELHDEAFDQPAPQDFPEGASEIPLATHRGETAPTISVASEPAPLEVGSTSSIDPVALPPVEKVATESEAVFPITGTEIRPEATSDVPGKLSRWGWVAAGAAIVLLGGILFISRKPAPPGPAPAKLGDLRIESEPSGADFALDGGSAIKTPHTFKDLSFGTHRFTMTLEGYSPIERDLQFDGSNLPKIVLEPKPKPREEIAKLTVRSDPPGALIRLDGTLPQEPPNTFTNVKFGKHQLTAVLEGFEAKEQTLPVHGEMTDIVLKLDRAKPTPSLDPLQALVDERKASEAARDWSKYHSVSLQLLRRLTAEGEPASQEHRDLLVGVLEGLRLEGLRSKKPALSDEEFRTYEKNFKYAAKLDLVPAILLVADNLRLRKSTEAFDWYSYAAETKHVPYAMTKIAWLYWLGECGRPADKGEGIKWFKLAHAAGDTDAGVIVGNCYLRGFGTAKDEDAGIRILLPLAEAGVAAAKTYIGQCYYDGLGQFAKLPQKERDRMAKTFYEGAIEAGDWQACGHLGVMYEVGRGVPKDWQQAARLYLQGVEQENPICMYYYALAIELHGAELMKLLGRQDNAETYYVKAAAGRVKEARDWCIKNNVKFEH